MTPYNTKFLPGVPAYTRVVITYAELAFLGGPVHLGGADRSPRRGLAVLDGRVVAIA